MSQTMDNNIDSPTDAYQICCCCLELVCLKSLWSEYVWMGRTEVYGNMLKECFNLSWPQSDTTKDQICEVCITQLRNAVHFKQKVLQCQVLIKSQHGELLTKINNESAYNEQNDNFGNDCDSIRDEYDLPSVKSEEIDAGKSEIFEDLDIKETPDITAVKRKGADDKIETPDIKAVKRKILIVKRRKLNPPKRDKVEIRNVNYVKPRQNVCLILEHSTILPFKSIKGYFNCLYCNKQFVGFDELKIHVNDSHENISFKSILKSILRPHDRIKADVSDLNCRICKKKLDNLEGLITHLSKDHSIIFNFDDKVKPVDCILAYDMSEGKYRCYECKEEFLFFKTLSKHMNEHSTDYVCDVCGRCFLLPERLRAHTQMHNTGNSVKCEFCGKICGSNILLKSHIRHTHKKLSFMCSICDKTFQSYRLRMRHLEEVHKRAPLNLNCKLCSKKFGTPNGLNSHMRRDHLKIPKERKHGCDICGFMFKSRHALSNHMIVHSGEKKYECDICHKRYARANTLTEHLKIHLNDRRWSCGVCSQAFVQKCSLKNHIRVHHVDMDFEQLIVYKKPDK